MKNYRQKILRTLVLIAVCIYLLMQISGRYLTRFYSWLFLLKSPRQLFHFILRGNPQSMYLPLLILFLHLLLIIFVLRFIVLIIKASVDRSRSSDDLQLRRYSHSGRAGSGPPANSGRSTGYGRPPGYRRPTASGRSARQNEDSSFYRATGSDHYMEQLDSFLKSGIITREEYETLRSRHR